MNYQVQTKSNIKIITMILLVGFVLFNFIPISYGELIEGGVEKLKEEAKENIKKPSPEAPKTISKITCPKGSQAYYAAEEGILITDPTGDPKGCSVPPESTVRDPKTQEIKTVKCSSGSQAYYSKPSTLHKYTVGLFGEPSQFKTCLAPPTSVEWEAEFGGQSIGTIRVKGYQTMIDIPCQPIAGGQCPTTATPAGYIARLYQFGLMIAGLVAFGAIIFGAIKYILSAGSITSQQDAREQITQAIIGLILLLGAYLILNTINPALVSLRNPQAEIIDVDAIRRSQEQGMYVDQDTPTNEDFTRGEAGFCKTPLNLGITVSGPTITGRTPTGEQVFDQIRVGGEKTGWVCIQCEEGHTTDDGRGGKDKTCPYCKEEEGYKKMESGRCEYIAEEATTGHMQ